MEAGNLRTSSGHKAGRRLPPIQHLGPKQKQEALVSEERQQCLRSLLFSRRQVLPFRGGGQNRKEPSISSISMESPHLQRCAQARQLRLFRSVTGLAIGIAPSGALDSRFMARAAAMLVWIVGLLPKISRHNLGGCPASKRHSLRPCKCRRGLRPRQATIHVLRTLICSHSAAKSCLLRWGVARHW